MKSNILSQLFFVLGLLVIFVVAIFGVIQLRKSFQRPPKLEINGGSKFATTDTKFLISGVTDPGATVKISGNIVKVGSDGTFSYTAELRDGEQQFEVAATRLQVKKVVNISVTKAIEIPAVKIDLPANNPSIVTGIGESGNLVTSGPKEDIIGAFGLAAMICTIQIYRKSKTKLNTGYKAFTLS